MERMWNLGVWGRGWVVWQVFGTMNSSARLNLIHLWKYVPSLEICKKENVQNSESSQELCNDFILSIFIIMHLHNIKIIVRVVSNDGGYVVRLLQ